MHGGTVEVRSEGLGRGSEFLVRLRALGASEAPEVAPGPPEAPARGELMRVLIVDDNVHAAESLAIVVKLWGHDTRVAFNGPEALVAAHEYHPQIILLDIGLPGMDGYAVAGQLRIRGEFAGALLVAMTGYGRDEDIRRSEMAGFDRHLVKPLNFEKLEAILAEVGTRGGH